MKSKLILMMFAAIVLFSCQKRESEPVNATQDVVFSANVIEPGAGLKSTEDWECLDLEPDYAHIVIDGTDYYPAVFRLDGVLYTQAIKLPVGSYTVETFLLMDDNGTPNNLGDDQIVMGTPESGSDYAVYVSETVEFDFEVEEFTKIELDVEVLCFLEADYDSFGFDWFQIDEIVIREVCFFGDLCLNGEPYSTEDFEGSPYSNDGLQEDEAAIFDVKVFKNGVEVPNSPFSNLEWLGVGQPLCVQYPDKLNIDGEVFTFELWVLVKVGNVFTFYLFDTYTAIDNGPLTKGVPAVPALGIEGVADFAIGTCSPTSTNIYAWPATYYVTVKSGDLAAGFNDPDLAVKWFFYNDETDQIDNTLGSFVAGPGVAPAGTGSAQVTVSGTQRRNLATYQFAGTPLSQITTLAFSTYNASATNNIGPNASGYLQFNVDFDGTDTWQKRLIYLPWDNGAVTPDTWKEWNTVAPGSLWRWSGAVGGGMWPDGVIATTRTWSDILTAFPGVRVRVSDPWMGIRVGEPYNAGYTENLDLFKFQTGGPMVQFNFDN